MRKTICLLLAVPLFVCGAPFILYGMFLQYVFWWNIEIPVFNPFWRLEALLQPAFWEATLLTLFGAVLIGLAGFLIDLVENK